MSKPFDSDNAIFLIRMIWQGDEEMELGKHPYQKFLLVVGTAVITLIICVSIGYLMANFLN